MFKYLVSVMYILFSSNANVLPPYASKYLCHLSDPDFNACLLNNTNLALRDLKNGVPEADIPPIDPMFVEHFESSDSFSQILGIGMIMDNLTILGQSETDVRNFTFNLTDMTGKIDFYIPVMNKSGVYSAYGSLLGIPITSKAAFQGNFTEIYEHLTFKLERVNVNGTDYYNATSVTQDGYIGSGHLKLTPLRKRDTLTVYALERMFNENDSFMMWAAKPQIRKASEKFYKELINAIINRVPADEMLPE